MRLTEEQKVMLNAPAEEQVKLYFNTIHERDQKGGQFVSFVDKNKSQNYVRNIDNSITNNIKLLRKYKNISVYTTLNSYKLKKEAKKEDYEAVRHSKNLWGLDCIMIDIDGGPELCGEEQELVNALSWFWGDKAFLPKPNYISFTGGGGIHLYFAFNRLPKSMEKSIRVLKLKIAERLVELEQSGEFPTAEDEKGREIKYKIDMCVMDSQRMDRVPGSVNPKTGKMCVGYATGQPRYDYSELKAFLIDEEKYCAKDLMAECKSSISEMRGNRKAPAKDYNGSENKEIREKKLCEKRIEKIFILAESGKDFYGCRERTAFVITNLSKSAGHTESETVAILNRLNQRFHEPLSDTELFNAIRQESLYKFKNETIAEYLCLNDREFKKCFRLTRGPEIVKNAQKKIKLL